MKMERENGQQYLQFLVRWVHYYIIMMSYALPLLEYPYEYPVHVYELVSNIPGQNKK